MAKLTKDIAKRTEAAEAASGFEPVPSGVYHLRLRSVDPTRSGPKGPYWVWEYEILEEEYRGRRQWNNTSLGPDSAGFLKAAFESLGGSVDTDTDELLGKVCLGTIGIRTIQTGDRKGELANQVNGLKPVPEDDDFEIPEAEEGKPAGDDIF